MRARATAHGWRHGASKTTPTGWVPKGLICFVTKSLVVGQLPWKSSHSEKPPAFPARWCEGTGAGGQKVVLPFEVEPHPRPGLPWRHRLYKNLPVMQETQAWSPGSGRSPGEGNDNPLQYSCLKNFMHRGAQRVMVHAITKSWTWLTNTTTPTTSTTRDFRCIFSSAPQQTPHIDLPIPDLKMRKLSCTEVYCLGYSLSTILPLFPTLIMAYGLNCVCPPTPQICILKS